MQMMSSVPAVREWQQESWPRPMDRARITSSPVPDCLFLLADMVFQFAWQDIAEA